MNVWIITGAFLLLATLQPLPDSFGEPKFLSVTDPSTNLSFTVPRSFHLVRYADDPRLQPAQRDALPRVLVLVEQRLHRDASPIAIGSMPAISIDVLTGPRAAFNQVFLKPEFQKTIQRHTVYELPAHQGPVHQQVFYYLVPLSPDRILEISGHRYYFAPGQLGASGMSPTHYDDIIAGIIGSLAPFDSRTHS